MKATAKVIVVLVCTVAVLLAGGAAQAQEAEPPPATPEQVLRQFSELSPWSMGDIDSLRPLLTEESVAVLDEFEGGLFFSCSGMLLSSELQPLETEIEGERCTVTAVSAPRAVQIKLVKENDQWKIDLLGTVEGFEELLWQVGDPDTPEDVVKLFGTLAPVMMTTVFGEAERLPESIRLLQAALKVLLSADSRQLLENGEDERLGLLFGFGFGGFAQSELWPQEVRIEEKTATISALSYQGVRRIKLVKEHGEWKIDLVATLEELHLPWEEEYEANECLSNVKQIVLGFLMYAQDHDEHLPPADKWMDEMYPYMRNEEILRCPEAPELGYGYAFNADLSGANLDEIDNPSEIVLIFDSRLGTRNAAGGPEALADPPRHNDGNNYGFVDGHAKWSRELPDFGKPAGEAPATAEGPEAGPVLELNSAKFAEEVLRAEGLVLIDAWGFFCEPCEKLKPIFHEVAIEYAGRAKFCSLNLDLAEDIAEKYGLRIRPTLIMFAGGQEIDRRMGLMTKDELTTWLDQYLQP